MANTKKPAAASAAPRAFEDRDEVTIRFAGDSGDGMQLAGALFTAACAAVGNDISTLPDFPAEIRAPAGALAGVSGYQVHFSRHPDAAPGDRLTALVAMNPAALQANLKDLEPNGVLLVNSDAFNADECAKAGYDANPLDDRSLDGYRLAAVPVDRLNRDAVAKLRLHPKDVDRSKNFFALGLVCWLYDRSLEPILKWNRAKFAANLAALEGNTRALKAGYRFAETSGLFGIRYFVPKAPLPPGTYRHITGTDGLLLGLRTAARLAGRVDTRSEDSTTPTSGVSDRRRPQAPSTRASAAAATARRYRRFRSRRSR